ncbi:MAG TPA: cupin domain-containing protein [Calidithermus sp.]|nr:cupin domain-containing protein [Calidithermus sp.]
MGTRIRLATLPELPFQNENQRLVRIVFRRINLPDSQVLAFEQSVYFTQGSSPLHADNRSEEIVYIRRGTGYVQVDDTRVPVRPGTAVAIPRAAQHRVVNTGRDVLEHLLICADLARPAPSAPHPAEPDDLITAGPDARLERLTCRRLQFKEGEGSARLAYSDQEVIYALSGGFAVIQVSTADRAWEWEYAVDASHAFWLPPGTPHAFRNVGDSDLTVVGFLCDAR